MDTSIALKLFGHTKWYTTTPSLGKNPLTYAELLGLALVILGCLIIVQYVRKHLRPAHNALDNKLSKVYQWMPTVVGVSSGIALLALSLQNYLLAPNVSPADPWLIGLQWAIGLCWLLGIYTRYASFAMMLLLALVLFRTGPLNFLEHFEYLAAAVYLAMVGRGRLSIEESIATLWKPRYKESASVVATPLYRSLAGISFVTLALSEKILNLPLGIAYMESHYAHSWLLAIGTTRGIVLLLGALELVMGLMLVIGIAPRIAITGFLILTLWSIATNGMTEVWGHLYFVGLFAAIWVSAPTTLHAARKHYKRPRHTLLHTHK